MKRDQSIIQERTINEDVEIFAKNLHQMGLMSERDYKVYSSLFEVVSGYLQAPDLLIYLRAEGLSVVRQIKKRGREYESSIKSEYLERLNTLYEEWIVS